jgi:hypothetical protein
VILANSRPYEGLIFAVPLAVAVLIWLIKDVRPSQHCGLGRILTHAILPLCLVLLLGGLMTGWYYKRVTGSAFTMTYQVNRGQYATAPYFIWQTPQPEPTYHHVVMRDFYRWELGEFERSRTLRGYLLRSAQKIESWWQFYLGPLLIIPLLALPWMVRQRKMLLPITVCGSMIAGFSIQTWTLPHYFSPATGALYILLLQGLRHMRQWRRRRGSTGIALVRAVTLIACAMVLLRVTAAATHTHIEPDWPRGNLERAAMVSKLRQLAGQQLVLVRYGPHHDVDHEWVWNEASIDEAKVVWARDMGEEQNQELVQYFAKRQVWALAADEPHAQPTPYLPALKTSLP